MAGPTQSSTFNLFGIRHHGPGSAGSLLRALEAAPPDLILIEGPPDAEPLLALAGKPDMRPPVAILVYNPRALRQASFFPFAEYSPEWQALQFGLRRDIPVRFMDLPQQVSFALRPDDVMPAQQALDLATPEDLTAADPFTEIARLAGYTDPERWWEATFERILVNDEATPEAPPAVFDTVLTLMQALRDAKEQAGYTETRETLLREAFMRQTIRQAEKEGFQRIAIVCGAWHTPALARTGHIKATADAALLKGLKKVKTKATWIPWSFDRLTKQSGYGAGVLAPAWYREIWQARATGQTPQTLWFSRAAHLLRQEGQLISSAHVIEAVRLAETLAALRNTLLPGIEELREAAVTVLCEGAEKSYELIERQLVVGETLGEVPDAVPAVPLRADFEAQVRSARLQPSPGSQSLELDLRQEAHLRKSRLLHRLRLLGVPWGMPEEISRRKEGRFHENWTLQWFPEYEIRLIEAGAWGNTVEEAASRYARQQMSRSADLSQLVAILDSILKADLPALLPDLLQNLQNASALTPDALALAATVLPLVEVLRYGHARRMDLPTIERLLEQTIPRVCLLLPDACRGINEELSGTVRQHALNVHRALSLWRPAEWAEAWHNALRRISTDGAPLLAGLADRLLLEQSVRAPDETARVMQFRLSHAQPPQEAVQWLEGFLYGSGLLLLHQPDLWQILDQWIGQLSEDSFAETLPLLRRTFSRFSGPEREKMLDLARGGPLATNTAMDWDAERAALIKSALRHIFGE